MPKRHLFIVPLSSLAADSHLQVQSSAEDKTDGSLEQEKFPRIQKAQEFIRKLRRLSAIRKLYQTPPPLQKNILSKCANHPTKAEFTSATPTLGVIKVEMHSSYILSAYVLKTMPFFRASGNIKEEVKSATHDKKVSSMELEIYCATSLN